MSIGNLNHRNIGSILTINIFFKFCLHAVKTLFLNVNLHVKYTVVILSLALISACSKDIDVELTDFESRLVVNSMFTPDSIFTINVSKTGNLADPSDNVEFIDYAKVLLYSDSSGESRILTSIGDGNYIASTLYPEVNVLYSVEVEVAGFKTVTAHGKIPNPVVISSVDTAMIFESRGEALQVDFDIESTNESDDTEYYIWDIFDANTVKGNNPNPFAQDAWIENAWLNTTFSDTDFISDSDQLQSKIYYQNDKGGDVIQGSVLSFEQDIFNSSADSSDQDSVRLMLRLLTVSPELYEYSKSIELYNINRNIGSNQSTPLEIYSNVENGLGIFGGYNQTLKEL